MYPSIFSGVNSLQFAVDHSPYHSTVPAGWKLVNGYTIPSTITFGPDGHKDIVVQVEHATITITPDTPEDQIPNGKVPGDPD